MPEIFKFLTALLGWLPARERLAITFCRHSTADEDTNHGATQSHTHFSVTTAAKKT